MTSVKLNDEDFKLLALALRTMHARGRELETVVRKAKVQIAQAEVDAHQASSKMRETLDPLAEKYGFDPDLQYELDYSTKSLVPKKV